MSGLPRIDGEEDERLVAGVHRAVRPARRHVGDRAPFHPEGRAAAFLGHEEEVAASGQAEVHLARVAHGVVVALRHEVLVADGAGVDHGRAADELPRLLGHVVLEDLVHERVAAVGESRERGLVGERAAQVGGAALDAGRRGIQAARFEVESEGERVEQGRAHGSITTFSARPEPASSNASRAELRSKRASIREAVSTRPSKIRSSAARHSSFVLAVVPVTTSSL